MFITTPRPYGGDIGRTNVHYDTKTVRWRHRSDERSLRHQDRTVATSNGRMMQTVPRPYDGDIERTASSFVRRMPLYLRVPSPRGGEFLSLNIILSGDSLRRYDKESTRTDSSRYIFIILYKGMIRRISTATHTPYFFLFHFYYVVISYIYDSTYRR